MRVLCIGDRFITADALADAAIEAFGADTDCTRIQTAWPDEPFGPVDEVREASGDPDDIVAQVGGAEVLLTHLGPVTSSVFDAASALRVVGSTRGGPVNIDLDAATAHGIPVIFLPGRNLEAAAEFTIGLMIALPRGIASANRKLVGGEWDASYFRRDVTGPELGSATVGVIGAGAIGRRVAELAAAFGARVLVHDPYAAAQSIVDAGWNPVELGRLLADSDIVSVHARLTDDTRRMFTHALFDEMKPGAYFVNTARGELVDEAALLAALQSGRLAGAALDVHDPEPPRPDDPLVAHPRVLATPHLAGSSRQVAVQSARRVAAEAAAYLRTGRITNCANPTWVEHARADADR